MTEQQMTIKEIENQFESEWVLVADPQTNDALEVTRGTVICHSQDRDEVYRQAVALRPKRSAILYTGRMPEDTAIVLGTPFSIPKPVWSLSAANCLGRRAASFSARLGYRGDLHHDQRGTAGRRWLRSLLGVRPRASDHGKRSRICSAHPNQSAHRLGPGTHLLSDFEPYPASQCWQGAS